MKKKLVALLLVLTMAVCIFPASAFAEDADGGRTAPKYVSTAQSGYNIWVNYEKYIVPYGTVISNGSSGREVYIAQIKFNEMYEREDSSRFPGFYVGDADSVFGDKTETGARTFQTWYNAYGDAYDGVKLTVDGIVGPMTWQSMAHIMYPYIP